MVSFFSVFRHRCVPLFVAAISAIPISLAGQAPSSNIPSDVVIQNATVMTVTHGTIQHGSVWIHNGKIAGVGATVMTFHVQMNATMRSIRCLQSCRSGE